MNPKLRDYREALDKVSGWAQDELTEAWNKVGVDRVSGEVVRDAMIEAMYDLEVLYDEVATGVASDWYEAQRIAAGVDGVAPITFPEGPDFAVLDEKVRYDARFLWDREVDRKLHDEIVGTRVYKRAPDKMLDALKVQLDRFIQDQARWTISETAAKDGVGVMWRRVAMPTACDHCKELSAEGWQWPNRERAEMNVYHDNCKCMVQPKFMVAPF